MYLREMGTVPLLTRDGEVEIAKRIERGKLSVLKILSRTPSVARAITAFGDELKDGDRTPRELVVVHDATPQGTQAGDREQQVLDRIDAIRVAQCEADKRQAELDRVPKRERQRHRACQRLTLRARRAALASDPRHGVHRAGQGALDRGTQGIRRSGAAHAA